MHVYIIILKCTVDPVLFENFLTEDGDLLRAKFQAFKFPETNFVLFKGVVNVCLDRCNGVQCSNGQVGYGRRKKRELNDDESSRQQRIYEVSMSTLVKVGEEKVVLKRNSQGQKQQTFVSEEAVISEFYHPEEIALARLREAFGPSSPAKFINFQTSSASKLHNFTIFTFFGVVTTIMAAFLL